MPQIRDKAIPIKPKTNIRGSRLGDDGTAERDPLHVYCRLTFVVSSQRLRKMDRLQTRHVFQVPEGKSGQVDMGDQNRQLVLF